MFPASILLVALPSNSRAGQADHLARLAIKEHEMDSVVLTRSKGAGVVSRGRAEPSPGLTASPIAEPHALFSSRRL